MTWLAGHGYHDGAARLLGAGSRGRPEVWPNRPPAVPALPGLLGQAEFTAAFKAGGVRQSGTVTFLFTDIQRSTKRWEPDPAAMRVELATHHVLSAAVEGSDGWLFEHTGDGVGAALKTARAADRCLRRPITPSDRARQPRPRYVPVGDTER